MSPWTARANELLADGLWRDREWLIRQMMPLVPPGRALRETEKDRVRQSGRGPRTRQRSEDYLIRAGQRSIVAMALGQTRKYNRYAWREDPDGRVWIRRTDVPDPYEDSVPVAGEGAEP